MHWRVTQPLRSHCAVPTAWVDVDVGNDRILELADRARAADRTLYVLASRPDSYADRPVGQAVTLLDHDSVRLEQTLTMPPSQLESYGLDVLAAPVTQASAAETG